MVLTPETINLLINEHLIEARKAKRTPGRELWADFHQRTADTLAALLAILVKREAMLGECREMLMGLRACAKIEGDKAWNEVANDITALLARLEAK